jgi:hypothetical protein
MSARRGKRRKSTGRVVYFPNALPVALVQNIAGYLPVTERYSSLGDTEILGTVADVIVVNRRLLADVNQNATWRALVSRDWPFREPLPADTQLPLALDYWKQQYRYQWDRYSQMLMASKSNYRDVLAANAKLDPSPTLAQLEDEKYLALLAAANVDEFGEKNDMIVAVRFNHDQLDHDDDGHFPLWDVRIERVMLAQLIRFYRQTGKYVPEVEKWLFGRTNVWHERESERSIWIENDTELAHFAAFLEATVLHMQDDGPLRYRLYVID